MATVVRGSNPDQVNRRIFFGAIILAALAAVLVFFALSNFGGGSSNDVGAGVDVVVAGKDIPAGHKIIADDLSIATLPRAATISGALTDKTAAVGLTSAAKVLKGEQISLGKLGKSDCASVAACGIPTGRVAMAVDVNEASNVAGLVSPGDHVNVIVIGTNKTVTKDDPLSDLPVAVTLLQNVEVYSVSDKHLKPTVSKDAGGGDISSTDSLGNTTTLPSNISSDPSARTVTLLVTPDQEAKLALATQSYKVHLALRAPGDDTTIPNPEPILLNGIQ